MSAMKDAELAYHYGFGDGMRDSVGQPPVYLLHPISVRLHEEYFRGFKDGQDSATKFLEPERRKVNTSDSLVFSFFKRVGRSILSLLDWKRNRDDKI